MSTENPLPPRASHSGRMRLGDADVFVHVLPGGASLVEVTSIEPLLGLPESGLGAFLSSLPEGGGRVRFLRAAEACAICKAPATHKVPAGLRCGGCAGDAGALYTGPTAEAVGVPGKRVPDILRAYAEANADAPAGQKALAILATLTLRGLEVFARRRAEEEAAAPKPPEFVNGKRIHLPAHLNFRTLKEEPHQLVGYTGDGHVAFTEKARALIASGEIDCETADLFFSEVLRASLDAKRLRDEAQGLNQWLAKALGGGIYEVTHRGKSARFRPIVNGKRRSSKRTGQRCTVCRREMPEGATMYVYEPMTGAPDHAATETFRHHRACETCMRPELSAALIGAALLGKEKA